MLNIFSCAYWPSVFLIWRNIYLGLQPIYGLGCSNAVEHHELFVNLRTSPLLVTLFEQIFSPSLWVFCVLFVVYFAMQTLLSLSRPHLFIFVFISIIWEMGWKRYCCGLCQKVFCLRFPLGVLQCLVSHLGLQPILSLFLCMMLKNNLTSSFFFFCM